ncbi:MAG: hypothetical protein IKB01_11270 [Lachnospiraceae bacterium]|nr:hypothetical protein [Lachnospiraceae bacterium]
MGFIKDYVKSNFDQYAKESWDELKRVTKSVFGYHKGVEEVIAQAKFSHYLLIKHEIKSGADTFEIFDIEGKQLYNAKGTFWLGRHHVIVYKGNTKIGEIRKKLYVFPDIDDWHKDRHQCDVFLGTQEINCVEAYRKSEKQIFKIKGWKISYDAKEDAYLLNKNGSQKVQLNEVCRHEYVVGYDDIKQEEELILLLLSFVQINNAIMNR